MQVAVGLHVSGERLDDAVRGELGGPHHVDRQDVVTRRTLVLRVLDHRRPLLVGLVGQLDEGDLLVGVVLVPGVEPGLHLAGRVLALDVGDGSRLRPVGAAGTGTATGTAVVAGATGCDGEHRGDGHTHQRDLPHGTGSGHELPHFVVVPSKGVDPNISQDRRPWGGFGQLGAIVTKPPQIAELRSTGSHHRCYRRVVRVGLARNDRRRAPDAKLENAAHRDPAGTGRAGRGTPVRSPTAQDRRRQRGERAWVTIARSTSTTVTAPRRAPPAIARRSVRQPLWFLTRPTA